MGQVVVSTSDEQYAYIAERLERRPLPKPSPFGIRPTRRGIDPTDRTTPFIHERLELLHAIYHGYGESYWDSYLAYADVVLLRDGELGFPLGRDIREIRVHLQPDAFVTVPRIERHREAAIELFKQLGRLRRLGEGQDYEINVSARFLSWPDANNDLELQPADYLSQIATNLTLDWASGLLDSLPDATIRNSIEKPVDGRLSPLGRRSRLANTLGVAVMLRTGDGRPLLTVRSSKTAVLNSPKPRLHCSASGVFRWDHFEGYGENPPFSRLLEGMRAEIEEELGLPASTYRLFPLALARELPRGGKPQLFCAAECELTLSQIRERMQVAEGKWEWLDLEEIPETAPARKVLEKPERIPPLAYPDDFATYEGWMAWSLYDAYHSKRPVFDL